MLSRSQRLSRALCFALVFAASAGTTPAEEPESPFSRLELRSIGPAIGGRASRVIGVAGDPRTFYAAFAQSGVWKSENGGADWNPIFDEQGVSSIGSIAVAPSDSNVVYVGTGEANIRGNVIPGTGIFRSSDAGKTWKRVWSQEGQIGTVVVHPTDPDTAFAAVLGHAFGPNPERGVYRTTDGGATWRRVLTKDERTGASDVALDPNNPRIVFAGLWQARRQPWEMTSGGPGSGLYRSSDGGETWTQLTGSGLPDPPWGKVGVAVARSDSRRVYALIEAEEGGLYRSDDGGETWSRANGHRALRQRAWYYSTLTIDPTNADVVWFPQVPMLRTIDGGKTIQNVPGFYHGDHHDLWIDPLAPRSMIVANDGGIELSIDGGKTWWAPKLPTAQFYNIDADHRLPYHVGGTIQDQGTASGPSHSLRTGGIVLGDWKSAGGGEAGDFVYELAEPGNDFAGQIFAGEYGGIVTHFDEATGQARNVSIYPTNPSGHGGEDLRVRFQWTAPIAVSPHDPKELYHGANALFRSTDRGQTWTAVSPDLTRDDESKQKWSGGPITGDNTGVEIYGTIFSLALSPRERGLIWAGTDDGLVHLTRDGGATWKKVTPPGAPDWGTVESIEASRFDAATAYVVVDNHRLDDRRPHVFKTTDFGQTWKSITRGLPSDVPALVLREDNERRELLFLGSERGLWLSRDAGASWSSLQLNLPPVSVTDLVVKEDDLVVGTRGRSIWILDDLTPLREWSEAVEREPLHLFNPRPARRWRLTWGWSEEAAGENPADGAILHYRLAEKVESELTLEVFDAQSRLVRKLSSVAETPEYAEHDPDEPTEKPEPALANEPGLHRAVWDLRYEGARRLDRAKVDFGAPRRGFLAPPGRYTLRLRAGDNVAEAMLEILPDPRGTVSQADLERQRDSALEIRAAVDRVVAAVETVRSIRHQSEELLAVLADRAGTEALRAQAQKVVERCDALERRLHNPDAEVVYDILAQRGGTRLYSNLAFLLENLEWADGAPTQGLREVFAELQAELTRHEAELETLRAGDVAQLETLARELDLPRIVVGDGREGGP